MISLGNKMRLFFDTCQPKADNFTKNDHVACSSNDDLHVYVSVVSQDTKSADISKSQDLKLC
jgi:hypothetical protein